MSQNNRLTRLEEGYTHLQKHVIEQDKAMLELSDALARIKKELAFLRDPDRATDGGDADGIDERPPHY